MRPTIRVTLVTAMADRVEAQAIDLAGGATLVEALVAFGVGVGVDDMSAADVGVWGKAVPLDTVLKHGDRIERYRDRKSVV